MGEPDTPEPDVIEKMVDRARCGSAKATAMVVTQGRDAWSRCVRVRDHEGDCVLALSNAQEVQLRVYQQELSALERQRGDLESHINKILAKKAKADAAWLT
jgi:hypothetical protein